jgi:hypothetical protein
MMADAAYCVIIDLRGCVDRGIELLAPVQANSFSEKKKQAKANRQIPRDKFGFDEARNFYQCPAGHELSYSGRERKQRHGGQSLWESRYRCAAVHWGSCPLRAQCLRSGSSSRTINRLEGQELLDAQRARMSDPKVQSRYAGRRWNLDLLSRKAILPSAVSRSRYRPCPH